jgi:hypothetical protein
MHYACWSDYASGNSYIYTITRKDGYGAGTHDIVKVNDWLYAEAHACRYGGESTRDGVWEVK